jgi:20S proteasome alpha/beta subunit
VATAQRDKIAGMSEAPRRRRWPYVLAAVIAPPKSIIPDMTVGIATICENRKAVVIAADRMATLGTPALVNHDADDKKISLLTAHCVAASSGAKPDAAGILDGSSSKIGKSIRDISSLIAQSRERLRESRIEAEIVRRNLGISLKEFREQTGENRSILHAETVKQIKEFAFAMTFIVAGVDDDGAHLFQVDDSPSPVCCDGVGYCSIGSGFWLSYAAQASRNNSAQQALAEAVFGIYCAKRAAELAPGVGPATDIVVIDGDGARFLPEDAIDEIRALYDEMASRPRLQQAQRRRIDRLTGK